MKPQNIEDILEKQDFQAWKEIHDGMTSKGQWNPYLFFEREERVELIQVYGLSGMITHIAWYEAAKQRENSQA